MNCTRYLMSISLIGAGARAPRLPSLCDGEPAFSAAGDSTLESEPCSRTVRSSHLQMRLMRFSASFLFSPEVFGSDATLFIVGMINCAKPSRAS